MKKILLSLIIALPALAFAQNVGIGTTSPESKLHIKGSADTSQLIIDANSTQSASQPLIRLRDATGNDLLNISSNRASNVFIGYKAGSNDFGYDNTLVGSSAGWLNQSDDNTAIGFNTICKCIRSWQ